jgi:uncharacterized protein
MRKGLQLLTLAIVLVAVVVFGGREFPNYAVRLAIFSVFLFVDIIYWKAFRIVFSPNQRFIKWVLGFIYWFPFVLLMTFIMAAVIVPIPRWLPLFRIYAPGALIVAYIGKIILILFMLAGELILLPGNILRFFINRKRRNLVEWGRLRWLTAAGLILSLAVMGLFITGMIRWVYDFQPRSVVISMDELPASFDGLTIVQISDIHLGSWCSSDLLAEAISIINCQKPDIIVFTGDMVNFSSTETLSFAGVLRQLKAPLGVYAVKGNHDYGDYISWDSPADKEKNIRDLNAFYKSIGWKLLDNSHQLLIRGDDTIVLTGVENWSTSELYGKRGNLKKALSGVEHPGFKILLSHDPTHWDTEVSEDYPDIDLTLSGHTHAMQMGWESNNCRWSPAQWKFNEWAGLYEHESLLGKQYLYVNRGLGNIAYPGRIGIRPEITLLQLRK